MKMNMAVGILLFGVSLFTKCLCVIVNEENNFEDANYTCESQNLILLSYGEKLVEEVLRANFTGKLWIGSPWYIERGCFIMKPNKTLQNGALYNCSTLCKERSFAYIGLQENSCACLHDFTESSHQSCERNTKLNTKTESLKFGSDDSNHWFIYKKEWGSYYKSGVVHVSQQRIFQLAPSHTGKEKFICTSNSENTTSATKTTVKKPQTGVSLTTPAYGNNDEKHNSVSDNSYMILTVVVLGIAALLILFVAVVAIIKKRNHTEIARDETEMQVMEHNYSSVQNVWRPTHENPSNDADVSLNKPHVILKGNEGNADTDVYDTAGASNNTQTNSSEIYDHTNSTDGVYDVTDHVKQKENDVDNTYDHV